MLLPILIIQTNVKKNLNNPSNVTLKPGFMGWVWDWFHTTTGKFALMLELLNTNSKILTLFRWLSKTVELNYRHQYSFVCGLYQQKSQIFFQMDRDEQDTLLETIKSDYREILIHYFTPDKTLKERIDKFIHAVFLANIPVPKIIEIHIEVIDEFSKQLRLEGRSDETLLDYRLTLIDILANLCEIYRCAVYK